MFRECIYTRLHNEKSNVIDFNEQQKAKKVIFLKKKKKKYKQQQ